MLISFREATLSFALLIDFRGQKGPCDASFGILRFRLHFVLYFKLFVAVRSIRSVTGTTLMAQNAQTISVAHSPLSD
jgi:hypothetical protein